MQNPAIALGKQVLRLASEPIGFRPELEILGRKMSLLLIVVVITTLGFLQIGSPQESGTCLRYCRCMVGSQLYSCR